MADPNRVRAKKIVESYVLWRDNPERGPEQAMVLLEDLIAAELHQADRRGRDRGRRVRR